VDPAAKDLFLKFIKQSKFGPLSKPRGSPMVPVVEGALKDKIEAYGFVRGSKKISLYSINYYFYSTFLF